MYSRITSSYKNHRVTLDTMMHNTNRLNKSKINTSFSSNPINKSVEKLLSKPLEPLSFKGNVIDIKKGGNYKVKTLMSGYAEISVKNNSSNLLIYDMYPNIDTCKVFNDAEFNDLAKTNDLINFFTMGNSPEEMVDLIRTFMPNSKEVGARLQNLGIEPLKYFEVKGHSEKLFLSDTGWVSTATEVENLRDGYNTMNWSQLGYTKDSVFKIDGTDYKLDDKGYLHVPEGTICIPSKVKIQK